MGKFGEFDFADMRAGKFPLAPMGVLSWGCPQAPPKSQFWADKSRNGLFLPEGFVLQFWNFTWAPK